MTDADNVEKVLNKYLKDVLKIKKKATKNIRMVLEKKNKIGYSKIKKIELLEAIQKDVKRIVY